MAGDAAGRGDAVPQGSALRAVIAPFVVMPGALLPVLHAVQAAFGHIDDAAVVVIADMLNLSRADVHGVLTFYHDFRRKPAGAAVLKICRAEACQAMGADALIAHAETRLATSMHSTRADGAISLEPVYCLGLCSAAPSAMLGGQVFARLSAARLDVLLAKVVA
ncbi:MAG: formate dehydrogenase subunit gamma [Sandarakinorhabdus sp.]|nr:formate dehydrogenase subunit gamma [Sandarakinorhabdus sp.]